MTKPIIAMSSGEKFGDMVDRSTKYLGPDLQTQWRALTSPENVVIMSATFLLWIGSHAFGVGEVVDVGLLLFGAVMLGPQIGAVFDNLLTAAKCFNAQTEPQMEECAKAFAQAVITGGIATIQAILLKKAGSKMTDAYIGPVCHPTPL